MITLYGIPNCDTVKKARKWLEARGVEHRFHDFRKDGLEPKTVAAWVGEIGLERLVNRRGTTWRKLDGATRDGLDDASAPALLCENPTLIKRPVIDLGEARLVGFDKSVQAELEAQI
ncbi:MAG: ArsC family reductase [Rhodospirillaceae bacterium]|jgi:arsenate reductase (glutaredoxin)|nr:ArsC family reductase [Rhodospirillaceae bacterium]MBT6137361.1 ArsC family reductase [Rhodospirillaceae bacterium]